MADTIAFRGIEKQYLVRFSYGLILPKMAHINAAIRKYQFCGSSELFCSLVTATARAVDVSHCDGWRGQQRLNCEFRLIFHFILSAHACVQQWYRNPASKPQGR